MTIFNNKGINYSKYVIDEINYWFMDVDKIYARVETFYNCREMGYVLEVRDNDIDEDGAICIWICAQRNSDEPMIVWEETNIPKESGNMFTEESYLERNTTYHSIDDAVQGVKDIIKNYFVI